MQISGGRCSARRYTKAGPPLFTGDITLARKTPEKKSKGLSRIDQPDKHGVGWYVRVTYDRVTFSKYFADGAHGGTEAARRKAIRWRNAKEREVGKPRTDRVVPSPSTAGRSGVVGVFRMGNHYVVAWSPQPGVLRRQFISIPQYGVREALRRAIELRRRKERTLYGGTLEPRKRPSSPRKRRSGAR